LRIGPFAFDWQLIGSPASMRDLAAPAADPPPSPGQAEPRSPIAARI